MNVCPCLGGLLSVDLCNPCVFSNHLPWWLTPISENMRGFHLFNHGCFEIELSFSCGLFKSDPTVVVIVSTIWHVTEIFWLHRNALPFSIGLGNLKSRISTRYLQILGTPKVLAPRSFSGTSHRPQPNKYEHVGCWFAPVSIRPFREIWWSSNDGVNCCFRSNHTWYDVLKHQFTIIWRCSSMPLQIMSPKKPALSSSNDSDPRPSIDSCCFPWHLRHMVCASRQKKHLRYIWKRNLCCFPQNLAMPASWLRVGT